MPVEQGQPLSVRELEITSLVAEGLTNREIAVRLFLSPNTIKVHLRNIFTKTGVSSRTELSMLAVQEGWIPVLSQEEAPAVPPEAMDEAETGEKSGASGPSLSPWPWQRWVIVSASIVIAAVVMLLPLLSTRSAVSLGPGQIFGPTQLTQGQPKSDTEGRWEERAPLPVRRAGMGVARLDGKAYIIGGVSAEGVTNRTDIFDIVNNQWLEGEPRPIALGNVAAVVLDGEIFVPGGCDSDWIPKDVAHLYNPSSDSWIQVSPIPQPLCAYALATYQGQVYLYGGWDGNAYTALGYVYNPEEDQWRSIKSPSVARGFGGAALLADYIFYIGGFDGRRELDICEVYNPEEDDWELCPSMLQPRGGVGVTATTSRIYVLGGGWDSFLGFNEQFSPESGQWMVMDTPIVGEWRNVGAFVWERSLYVIGGWSGSDFLNRTYAVEIMPFRVFMPGTLRSP